MGCGLQDAACFFGPDFSQTGGWVGPTRGSQGTELNLFCFLSPDWRADRSVLLRLYRALVRSKLDYGSIVFGPARWSVLRQLDLFHHQGLRIALGAFRTSPAQCLYVEAHEPSLASRRPKLALNYF